MTPCVQRCVAFIESRTGSRMTETKVHKHDKIRDDPMDLDSVVKGKGKNKFSGSCYICGKVGHKATECWSRDRASNKGSGRNPSAMCVGGKIRRLFHHTKTSNCT